METINPAGWYSYMGSGMPVAAGNKKGQVRNGSVFAGNMGGSLESRIGQKMAQARRQAARVIRDQFDTDSRFTTELDRVRTLNRDMREEMARLNEERKGYVADREALKDIYGIGEDSREQQELELLRRADKAGKEMRLGDLGREELERIANMGELTEYQERALAYDDIIEGFDRQIRDLQDIIGGNSRAIESTKLETVKNQGMLKALDAADEMLAAASDAIQGMLWEEARKHIQEEMEEMAEAAGEKAEEKAEEEERLEARREEREEQKELTELIRETASDLKVLQQEIDRILGEAGLVTEDAKGLLVDGII